MGCANSKTGACEGATDAPPKVMVDGEAQEAANGNAVACANGGGEAGESKEGGEEAPSGEQNSGEAKVDSSIQDGAVEKSDQAKESENTESMEVE